MNLPRPAREYNTDDQTQLRNEIALADAQNIKKNSIQVSFVMQSPNGSKFTISVSDGGALLVTAL